MLSIRSEPSLNDYISVEEHRQSTPASFSDEQPILYYHAEGLSIEVKGNLAGITGHVAGDIIISSSSLTAWTPELKCGVTLQYHNIVLHAIQSEPTPGVYLQVTSDEDEFVEVFIDTEDSKKLYEALSECSSLHPEPEGSEGDGEEGEFFMEEDGDEYLVDTSGQADDLPTNGSKGNGAAGLEVEISSSTRAGVRRAHEDEEGANQSDKDDAKWRRTN